MPLSKNLASNLKPAAPGYKRSKERVTVMACSNASGRHKFQLSMLIGKSAKPRALKNIAPEALPVPKIEKALEWTVFCSRIGVWTRMAKYLKKNDLPIQAAALLDNAPSHPNEEQVVNDLSLLNFWHLTSQAYHNRWTRVFWRISRRW
ncbi:hypothetical protein AMK59_3662 [Oryctes borbonicus]|uniref:DDE-1 domain-containing protein n=1 Tax=Oryctes borbonicus TaxID=1629725 RepID=A0A0T6B665_9SCAR|nr:hypothetical protein AMK59_3662 [Oryctes borbonicus]